MSSPSLLAFTTLPPSMPALLQLIPPRSPVFQPYGAFRRGIRNVRTFPFLCIVILTARAVTITTPLPARPLCWCTRCAGLATGLRARDSPRGYGQPPCDSNAWGWRQEANNAKDRSWWCQSLMTSSDYRAVSCYRSQHPYRCPGHKVCARCEDDLTFSTYIVIYPYHLQKNKC